LSRARGRAKTSEGERERMRPNYKHHLSPPPTPRNASEPFAYLAQERWNKVLAIAALAAVQTLFALGTVFVKWTLMSTKVNPIILLLYREISAAAILIMLSARLGAPLRKDFGRYVVAGFCMFLNQALFIVGVDLSGAVVASCIQPSQPIVTFGIAVLTGQETLDFNRCVGLGFAVVGAVWVVVGDMIFSGKSAAEVGKNSILGDCCLIANCVAMGFCYVIVKQLSKTYSPVVVIAWIYAYAAVALVFAAAFFVPASSAEWFLPRGAVPVYLYLVLVASVLGYIVISWSNRHLDSSQVSSFTCLQPMVGALGAFVFLGEMPTFGEGAGGVLIIIGLLVVSRSGAATKKLRL